MPSQIQTANTCRLYILSPPHNLLLLPQVLPWVPMSEESKNHTASVPQQYNNAWPYNALVTRYIDLYTEYLTIRRHIDRASLAYPFERERTIHNLVNTRARLEHENQLLRRQNQDLKTTNETNRSINKSLRCRYKDTQETLCAILEAQTEGVEGEAQRYQEEVVRLREENRDLRKRVKRWTRWGDVNAQDLTRMWDEEKKAKKRLDKMQEEVERLRCHHGGRVVGDYRRAEGTGDGEVQSAGEEGADAVETCSVHQEESHRIVNG